ncbi:DUF2225 domain-containing protein [Bacillus sp. 03113]|uniref:DUF2225 domain-containing protein n=1 Tax=Bacillus sp. 03113 TaxID=2578211 RepID=UPI001144D444|nr:DUF2225 domain-containing protein [Bacillus sp. 03113]
MTNIQPLYNKSYKCPLCCQTFSTKKMRSRFIKVSHYDTDFCPTYFSDELNPIFYFINICPSCGYSFSNAFLDFFPPNTKNTLYDQVCRHWVTQDFGGIRKIEDAIKTLKLAAYCANLKKEKHITVAGLYIRLAWMYRSMGLQKEELRFMNIALTEYLESYLIEDYQGTQVSELKVLYLIGELSRRTKRTEQSIRYFSKIIEQQNQSNEPRIIEMAKDRWHDIRDEQNIQRHQAL